MKQWQSHIHILNFMILYMAWFYFIFLTKSSHNITFVFSYLCLLTIFYSKNYHFQRNFYSHKYRISNFFRYCLFSWTWNSQIQILPFSFITKYSYLFFVERFNNNNNNNRNYKDNGYSVDFFHSYSLIPCIYYHRNLIFIAFNS